MRVLAHRFVLLAVLSALLLAGCAAGGDLEGRSPGEELYNRLILDGGAPGCVTCHSTTAGVVKVGPSHAGISARAEEILASAAYAGQATTVDEFLRESILSPDAYIEPGFVGGLMYQGYSEILSGEQVDELVAYLMTLR
jgi:mono/diheme cytochrome c family protein